MYRFGGSSSLVLHSSSEKGAVVRRGSTDYFGLRTERALCPPP